MKKRASIFYLILAVAVMISGCTDDFFLRGFPNQNFDEGELTESTISLSVCSLTVDAPHSRAENPDQYNYEDTPDERKINNFWVFQFDNLGNKLINPRYYTVANQAQLENFRILLKEGVPSTICIVTNTSDPDWVTDGGNFNTLAALEKEIIPNPTPQYKSAVSIPMWGKKEGVTINASTVEEIEVERMFARLDVKVKSLVNTLSLDAIEINNISWFCQVSSRFVDDATAAVYPDSVYAWTTRSWVVDSLPKKSEGEYDYVSIYVPENIQGEKDEIYDASQKYRNAPKRAMKVGFHVTYTEPETEAESEYTYYVNPGGNYYNYNVRRNCVYAVSIDVQHDDSARHTPSSNCIVVKPGKTASFEPYFRVETGGGYNFKDYLDIDDPTKKKVIDHVKIIWQSTTNVTTRWNTSGSGGTSDDSVFGDNSSGDKVWYNPTNQKIYVKSRNQGNALIAAYNEFDEIIWSWHIWSTNLDPQNVGHAVVYTTFAWDNTGTHFTQNRVPGYAVMNCNLGALATDPGDTEDTWFQTWGMYYQWGRKDPFPPVRTSTYNIDWTVNNDSRTPDGRPPGRTHSYDENYVTALYDNANNRITHLTEREKQFDGQLFYSYSVWKSGIHSWEDGIRYAIGHPTVFMGGDNEPGKVYDLSDMWATYACEDCNVETGDWMPVADNKLWGGLEPASVSKFLKIPGAEYNTIYDNYGTQKSIFDPCPMGWRVPPDNLWMSFTLTGLNPTPIDRTLGAPKMAEDVNFDSSKQYLFIDRNLTPGLWMYMQDWKTGKEMFFPTQGVRRPKGHISRVLMCGSYLSANVGQPITGSDTGGNWVNCLHMHYPIATYWNKLYFMVFEYANSIFRSKSTAGAVRCVRDTY